MPDSTEMHNQAPSCWVSSSGQYSGPTDPAEVFDMVIMWSTPRYHGNTATSQLTHRLVKLVFANDFFLNTKKKFDEK